MAWHYLCPLPFFFSTNPDILWFFMSMWFVLNTVFHAFFCLILNFELIMYSAFQYPWIHSLCIWILSPNTVIRRRALLLKFSNTIVDKNFENVLVLLHYNHSVLTTIGIMGRNLNFFENSTLSSGQNIVWPSWIVSWWRYCYCNLQ